MWCSAASDGFSAGLIRDSRAKCGILLPSHISPFFCFWRKDQVALNRLKVIRFNPTLMPSPIVYISEQHFANGSLFGWSATSYIIAITALIAKIFWYRKQENLISLKIPYF